MSSVMRPVGPEPPGVYWVRRLLLIVPLLLVLLLIWWFFFRSSGGGSASPSVSPSPTATATKTTKPTSSASPTSAKPSPTETLDCTSSDISVKVSTDKKSYPAGDPVKLTLTITNTSDSTCRRDVGAKANTLAITTADGQAVWSSDDCNPGGEANVVSMKPNDVYEVKLTWEGAVTAGSCPANPEVAKAGAYEAEGRNGDVSSPKTPFALT